MRLSEYLCSKNERGNENLHLACRFTSPRTRYVSSNSKVTLGSTFLTNGQRVLLRHVWNLLAKRICEEYKCPWRTRFTRTVIRTCMLPLRVQWSVRTSCRAFEPRWNRCTTRLRCSSGSSRRAIGISGIIHTTFGGTAPLFWGCALNPDRRHKKPCSRQ